MKDGAKAVKLLNAAGFTAVAGAMAHVLVHYSAYVARFHDMSLFNGGWEWFASHFDRPGALLLYAGRFLTQFCRYPVIAAVMLLAVLAGITLLIRRLLVKDGSFGALAVLPALMLFLFVSGMGYEVLTARADAQIFTQPLGVFSSLLMLKLLIRWSGRGGSFLPPVAATVAFYPLFGAYALLGAATFAAWSLFHTEGRTRAALPAASLLSAALIPWLYYLLCFDHAPLRYAWLAGTPFLDYTGFPAPAVRLASAAALLPVLALPRFRTGHKAGWAHLVAGAAVFALSVSAVYALPERRALFHRQMEAERAVAAGEWGRVLAVTATQGVTNDVLAAYRNCALYALGRLPQDCWKYSFTTVPISSGKTVYPSSRIAGPGIFYHSGLINYAARWASEISLYGTWSLERIQYLAKTALLNGEYALARKYIDTVGRTTLDRDWARKYKAYADNPSLMDEDPEFRRLRPLQAYKEEGWYPSDVAAYDVLVFYSFVKGTTPEMLGWNIAAALLTKSGQYFQEVYPDYAASVRDIPPEVLEARDFFNTLVYNDKDVSDPQKYVHFYYNATVLRPN